MDANRTLELQDWMIADGTVAVMKALGAGSLDVRFVGGCVRDAILEKPIKDVDIATPDPPETVMKKLQAAGVKAIPTGLAHGTITAVADGQNFEITTLRQDLACDGRHAKVVFTDDWRADAARRDLTINALSMSPSGTIYDYFGGLEDLWVGRVRFVGDPRARIAEDYLRLLRFFRFHAHYGRGAPDPAALSAATDLKSNLGHLSGERVREELLRLLAARDPLPMLHIMAERQVLSNILPGQSDLSRLGDLVQLDVEGLATSDSLLRLAALSPKGDPAFHADRLKLSNAQARRLSEISSHALAVNEDLGPSLYRRGAEAVRDSWLLDWAAHPLSHQKKARLAGLAQIESWQPKAFPLTGADLLERGLAPGPEVGDLLRQIEDWWIAAEFVPDRPACLAELDKRLRT
ncbi:MAG: CCA tRNA nucleotidyltransferase [Pseudomonadota bacterium]